MLLHRLTATPSDGAGVSSEVQAGIGLEIDTRWCESSWREDVASGRARATRIRRSVVKVVGVKSTRSAKLEPRGDAKVVGDKMLAADLASLGRCIRPVAMAPRQLGQEMSWGWGRNG